MSTKEDGNSLKYADQAFITFNEIMSNKQKNMIDNINRANRGELFVLHFLLMSKTEVLPSEISAALNSSTARISALLRALEKKGQIVRNIDKDNRRNVLVTLTDSGRERAEAEMQEIKNSMTQVFIHMGEEDTAEFLRLISKFFELFEKYSLQEENSIRSE